MREGDFVVIAWQQMSNIVRTRLVDGEGAYFFDIVGQTGHGVTAIGPDPWSAFEHIERLEHICKIVLASRKVN